MANSLEVLVRLSWNFMIMILSGLLLLLSLSFIFYLFFFFVRQCFIFSFWFFQNIVLLSSLFYFYFWVESQFCFFHQERFIKLLGLPKLEYLTFTQFTGSKSNRYFMIKGVVLFVVVVLIYPINNQKMVKIKKSLFDNEQKSWLLAMPWGVKIAAHKFVYQLGHAYCQFF
jgi:hypothetical protein